MYLYIICIQRTASRKYWRLYYTIYVVDKKSIYVSGAIRDEWYRREMANSARISHSRKADKHTEKRITVYGRNSRSCNVCAYNMRPQCTPQFSFYSNSKSKIHQYAYNIAADTATLVGAVLTSRTRASSCIISPDRRVACYKRLT